MRSLSPENGNWTAVETVDPLHQCEGDPAEYEVRENDPGEGWSYGVQVYGTNGLICTIVEQ